LHYKDLLISKYNWRIQQQATKYSTEINPPPPL